MQLTLCIKFKPLLYFLVTLCFMVVTLMGGSSFPFFRTDLHRDVLIKKLNSSSSGSSILYIHADSSLDCGDINHWDVSDVQDMSYLFKDNSNFNCDISNWDVSNVTNTTGMFLQSTDFNQDIRTWNLSNVILSDLMFFGAINFSDNYKPVIINK